MAYTKQTWLEGESGGTPLSPGRLTHMEDGIFDAAGDADSVASQLASLTKAAVGLGNVDNTSDANKPVSTATATAIAALTKSSVGLANVDNTSDANKPVSTAQATADALKVDKASVLAATGTSLLTSKVTGDAATRLVIVADGGLTWGDGTTAALANLYRAGSTVQSDQAINSVTDLRVGGIGVVKGSLLDAKGDLIVATADNTPAKLTVGANGKFLRADSAATAGVRWTSGDVFNAGEHGYLAWTGDPGMSTAGTLLSGMTGGAAGTLCVFKILIPNDITVTNICMYLTAPGGTLTAGQNFAALFNSSGTWLKSTADMAATWVAAAGEKVMPLTATQALTAGSAYVGLFYNGTTAPTFARFGNTSSNLTNVGLSAPNFRVATADTGRTTTMPGTIGTMTASNVTFWIGLT